MPEALRARGEVMRRDIRQVSGGPGVKGELVARTSHEQPPTHDSHWCGMNFTFFSVLILI